MSNAPKIPIKTISVLIIGCSFCKEELRKDQNDDVSYDTQDYHFRKEAGSKGWRVTQTTDERDLTLCPDHVNVAKEMGLHVPSGTML